MQNSQSLAFFTVVTGILAVVCLCLIASALHDILRAMEPSLSSEWNVIKMGVPAFIVLQLAFLIGIFKLLQDRKREAPAEKIAADP